MHTDGIKKYLFGKKRTLGTEEVLVSVTLSSKNLLKEDITRLRGSFATHWVYTVITKYLFQECQGQGEI